MLSQFYPQVTHPYKYELNKDMNFSSAHFIPSEGAGVCSQVHGHTYLVNVTVAGDELDNLGFLANFSTIKKLIHGQYDHTLLNDHEDFTNEFNGDSTLYPSTEIMAETIYYKIEGFLKTQDNNARCVQVIVRETPTSYVVYRPKNN